MNKGQVVQVMGPVVDVRFPTGQLPGINQALRVEWNGEAFTSAYSSGLADPWAEPAPVPLCV